MRFHCVYREDSLLAGIQRQLPEVRRVLVFAPHPDDEIFGCGGTLALLVSMGAKVRAIILTDGEAGMAEGIPNARDLRRNESCRAAGVVGCLEPEFWSLPDRGLVAQALVERMARRIVEERADLIFLPSPLEIHPDHQAVALAGLSALSLAALPCQVFFYEVSQPLSEPTHLIAIDRVMAKKREAMACFTSQLAQLPYHERISGLNRYRAYHLDGAEYAEAFIAAATPGDSDGLLRLFAPTLRTRRFAVEWRRCRQDNRQLISQLEQAKETISALNATIASLKNEIQQIRSSTSWRMTAPMRLLVDRMRKFLEREFPR